MRYHNAMFKPILTILVLAITSIAYADDAADRAAILDGVETIASPGVPGPLLVVGPRVFAVVAGKLGSAQAPVVAAGRVGRGRFVTFGHSGYLGATGKDTPRLLANSVRWAAGKNEPSVFAPQGTVAILEAAGIAAQNTPRDWDNRLREVDVICLGQGALNQSQRSALETHLRRGGGVVMAGLGWGWLQVTKNKPLTEHPGNVLFAERGLMWADGYLKDTADDGFDARAPLSPDLNAGIALETLQNDEADADARKQASETLMLAARTLPLNDRLLRPQIRKLAARHTASLVPSAKTPLRQGKDDLERFLLTWAIAESRAADPQRVAAHPASADFPGAPPAGTPRTTRSITIDPVTVGWKSTGAYAEAGRVIVVTIPKELAGKGLAVRIGCHKDTLYHKDKWSRAPEITISRRLDAPTTPIASAFGGPVYIDLPNGAAGEAFAVELKGVIDAPMFVLGQTDADAWRSTIRHAPAPWAELVTDKVILSVPSSSIRDLDDPDALMLFWDKVMDAAADLATISRTRHRPQRYVADRQISAGYMHSGYPIMTHLDAAADMTQLDRLSKGSWGLFHELGHNHQVGDWTFGGTGEVTCNLFALYIIQTICTPPPGSRGHPAATGKVGMDAYFKAGAPFDQWKRKPFLALRMYQQIQAAFGWEPFKAVFAEYRTLPKAERPKSDDEKRNQWMVRMSRTVGRNLGPFFEAWGVPTSAAARSSITDLPAWMPDGFEPGG
jgi:Peptidase M60, enhancin and enhancin-like/N-terminal domain of M60-like peptidases